MEERRAEGFLLQARFGACNPSTMFCQECTGHFGRAFYGVKRLSIDEEKPCPCRCHGRSE